ncbi:MAG TPA: HEAT repeat domain-containing protein, partial [Planctomycetota bacterium]|nr:HEAT repeat domain-containing protein [Planctomycetota bacterium]
AETQSDRLNLAGFIARAGPGAATVLLDEIAKTGAPSDVLRLLEVLPHSMPVDMAEMAMGGLLRHPAVAVRKRTAMLVAEQAYPRAGVALMDAFTGEADLPSKIVFVECLGRLRHKPAIDTLAEVIDSRNHDEELRCAACLALGKIGDQRAVAPLARLVVRGDKGLTKIFVKIPPSVRAAAVRALALFPSNPDARSAIRRAQEDGETLVRSAASQARYAPLYEAFGDLAQGVLMISNAADLSGEAVKVGGSLSEIPFESLCRKIAAAENMGLLNVNFSGPVGRIYFDAGVVIAAEYEGRRDHEAFTAMISRREGHFIFLPGEGAPERRILAPIDSLFEEAARHRSSGGR